MEKIPSHTVSIHLDVQKCNSVTIIGPDTGVQCPNDKQVGCSYCAQHMSTNSPTINVIMTHSLPTVVTAMPKAKNLTDYLVQNKTSHHLQDQDGFSFDANDMKQINAAGMRLMLIPEDSEIDDPEEVDNSDDEGKHLLRRGKISAQACNYVAQSGSNMGSRCAYDKVSGHNYCTKHLARVGCAMSKLD